MAKKLEIYTDGSSLGNPGPGGWGVVVVITNDELGIKKVKQEIIELGGGEKNTTNNRMELMGAIEALKFCVRQGLAQVVIHTDSAYVLNGITLWIHNWEKNGWKTANKKSVLNQDLWEKLSALSKELRNKVSWKKVKGHSGHFFNDRADEIATEYAAKVK